MTTVEEFAFDYISSIVNESLIKMAELEDQKAGDQLEEDKIRMNGKYEPSGSWPDANESENDFNRSEAESELDQGENRSRVDDEMIDTPKANGNEGSDLSVSDKLESVSFDDQREENSTKEVGLGLAGPVEIVGDRILIERDGKFELVDASEVKAQYFDMIGLGSLTNGLEKRSEAEEKPATDVYEIDNKNDRLKLKSTETSKNRPKTSPTRLPPVRPIKAKPQPSTRATSAFIRKPNPDYDHIRSRYAMTEQQLEMKRKREEAIARRKKEEEERETEEQERRRLDAERAFQAWLEAKNAEASERRRKAMENKNSGEDQTEKSKAAESAYKSWLLDKSKQIKQERTMEKYKLAEEAASYVIRDRSLCDEAFDRWMRKKRAEARQKALLRRPKKTRRKKISVKEGPPLNGPAIRFTDYYGYRNTVSL